MERALHNVTVGIQGSLMCDCGHEFNNHIQCGCFDVCQEDCSPCRKCDCKNKKCKSFHDAILRIDNEDRIIKEIVEKCGIINTEEQREVIRGVLHREVKVASVQKVLF